MSEAPELVSSSDDEGSWNGSLLDEAAEYPPAASTDFLSSQGFSTGFFDHARLGGVARGGPSAASSAGGRVAAPQLEPFSNLRNLQTQLRTLQDQLRSINDADDMGPYSPGQPDTDLWNDVDDEVERAMADLETQRLGGGPRGGSLFGPADTLSRLLSHMLGLGPSDAGGLGGNDRSHTLRMLDLGFPTAVDPRRCAALAAEGIPAGRMVGAQDEPRPRSSSPPSLSRLLDILDLDIMGQPLAPSLLGSRGRPFGAPAGGPRAMPRTAGQQRRSGFMWDGREGMPGLVDTSPSSSEDSEAYLTDGDGPPPFEDSSSEAPPRQRRRREGPAQRRQQQHAEQEEGAGNSAWDDSHPPALVSDASSSSPPSEGSEPEQHPAGGRRRRGVVHAAHRRARPPAAAAAGGGRAGSDEEGLPPLLSDGDDLPTSGSEDEGAAAAARDLLGTRSFSTGFFGSHGAPQQPSGRSGRGRQRFLLDGDESEPPALQSEIDGAFLGIESGESDSESEGNGSVGWPGGYTTSQRSLRPLPQPPRRRRDAIFGQLPGLGGLSPRELLEEARPRAGWGQHSQAGSDGPPGLESEGEGSLEQARNSGSDSERGSSWPGVVLAEEVEEADVLQALAAAWRAWELGAGSSNSGGEEEEGPPSLSSYTSLSEGASSRGSEMGDDDVGLDADPLPGTGPAAAATPQGGSSPSPQQWGSQRVLEATQRLAEANAWLGERLAAMNAQLRAEGTAGEGAVVAEEEADDMPRPLALDGGPAPQPVSFEDALALERAGMPVPARPLGYAGPVSATLGAPDAQVASGRSCDGGAASAAAAEQEAAGAGHPPEEAACSSRAAVGGDVLVAGTAAAEEETSPQSPKSPAARRGPSVVGRVLGAGAGLVRWIVAGTRSRDQAGGQVAA